MFSKKNLNCQFSLLKNHEDFKGSRSEMLDFLGNSHEFWIAFFSNDIFQFSGQIFHPFYSKVIVVGQNNSQTLLIFHFSHPWETVAQAAWRKYPNPMNTAVIGTDVVERTVVDGVLHTHRLVSSRWYFPKWAQRVSLLFK